MFTFVGDSRLSSAPFREQLNDRQNIVDRRLIYVRSPVRSQNLNPDILVMQPTQKCDACDAAELLRAQKIRRIPVQ
jgi:hypothetical protein